MTEVLNSIVMKQRYGVRTQAAFVRALRSMSPSISSDNIPIFNIAVLNRLHDFNPSIYVCAMSLIDSGHDIDPITIRDTKQFSALLDNLKLQSSSTSRVSKDTPKASLVLLEVFTYMIIITQARASVAEKRAALTAGQAEYHQDELFG